MEKSERDKYIAGLRAVADLLEELPEVPVNYSDTILVPCLTKEVFQGAVRAIAKRGRKAFDDAWAWYNVSVGPITLSLFVGRGEVCRKIVKGTEHIPERIIKEHDREIVEWECEPWLENEKETDNG